MFCAQFHNYSTNSIIEIATYDNSYININFNILSLFFFKILKKQKIKK